MILVSHFVAALLTVLLRLLTVLSSLGAVRGEIFSPSAGAASVCNAVCGSASGHARTSGRTGRNRSIASACSREL